MIEAYRRQQHIRKRKVKDDKKDAEEIRKRAMERLGEKRSENEGKVKKRRSSGN